MYETSRLSDIVTAFTTVEGLLADEGHIISALCGALEGGFALRYVGTQDAPRQSPALASG